MSEKFKIKKTKNGRVIITGKLFGQLTVIGYHSTRNKKAYWECKCNCGNISIASGDNLRSGSVKSCGCSKTLPPGEAASNHLFLCYNNNAKKRNLDFTLTKKEFLNITSQNCYYCGKEPKQQYGLKTMNGKYTYNGIDRIKNKEGYTLNNVVSCCKFCNFMKKDLEIEEFYKWVKSVYENINKN